MSLSYLQPIDESFTLDDYKPQQVGFQLHKHLPSLGLPDLKDVKIAFFCIETMGQSFYRFRQHLYSLFMGNWNFGIADLGNLTKKLNFLGKFIFFTQGLARVQLGLPI